MTRFLDGTFAPIDTVLSSDEDRASFIRYSVEAEIARRSRDFYSDLKHHLLVGQADLDFCLKMIRHAVQGRKVALAGKRVERARRQTAAGSPSRQAKRPEAHSPDTTKMSYRGGLAKGGLKSFGSFSIPGGIRLVVIRHVRAVPCVVGVPGRRLAQRLPWKSRLCLFS